MLLLPRACTCARHHRAPAGCTQRCGKGRTACVQGRALLELHPSWVPWRRCVYSWTSVLCSVELMNTNSCVCLTACSYNTAHTRTKDKVHDAHRPAAARQVDIRSDRDGVAILELALCPCNKHRGRMGGSDTLSGVRLCCHCH